MRLTENAFRTTISLLAGAMLVATAACGHSTGSTSGAGLPSAKLTAYPAGSSTQSLTFDGTQRQFIVFVPSDLPTRGSVPLVVMLHGGFGSATQAERDYGWDELADTDHFIVTYPNGLNRAWNAGGGCCGKPATTNVNDAGFITDVVKVVQSHENIDTSRIFATGMSNGGLMDYRLACTTDVFAAIGPVSGTLQGSCPHPEKVSVIHIHGSADTHVPYNGGEGSGPGHVDGLSIPAVNEMWRRVDECANPSVKTSGVVTTSIAPCPDGRSVELITVTGAGHQWPGSPDRPVVQRLLHTDTPSTALNATQTVWEFFLNHPKQPSN